MESVSFSEHGIEPVFGASELRTVSEHVRLVARAEKRIAYGVGPADLTEFERRLFGKIEIVRHSQPLELGDDFVPACVPADSAEAFKKLVNAKKRAVHIATDDPHALSVRLDAKALLSQRSWSSRKPRSVAHGTDDNRFLRQLSGIVRQR